MKTIKAYICYEGQKDWLHAHFIFENGWSAFGHLCSHPCFMLGDLWENRSERQAVISAMGYAVEVQPEIYRNEAIPDWLKARNADKDSYMAMADEYVRVEKELSEPQMATGADGRWIMVEGSGQ